MNILRHKSWHVRNRNNITRVRKDEEKARNEELEKEKRIALADSERRVHLLRQRQSQNDGSDVVITSEVSAPGTHLDIFQDFDDKIKTTNKDHEKEIKDEKETFEKKTGILNYLVDKDMDSQQNWYLDSHEKRMKLKDNKTVEKYSEKELKDIKEKKFNDPIEDMRRYLDAMKPKTDSKSVSKPKTCNKSIDSVKTTESSLKTKRSKKHKKHKKKKRRRHSTESSDSDDNKVKDVSKNLEQLRAQRLERERIERERTRRLLSGKSGDQSEAVIIDDRRRTYNSQFNPEIARQNANLDL